MSIRASIIITAYNAAATIEKAVQSALSQTERDIEVIVVDDGSKDTTRDIVTRLKEADPRMVTLFIPENKGCPYALNRAIDMARGDWIARLDADDWIDPTRIEKLIGAAEAAYVDMAADNQFFFDAKAGVISGTAFTRRWKNRLIDLDFYLRHTDPTILFDYGQLKAVIKAQTLHNMHVQYREDFKNGYDYFFLFEYFANGGHGILFDEPLYYYLQPYGSISRSWARPTDKRHPYALVKTYNDMYLQQYGDRLTADHYYLLKRRGEGLLAMERMLTIRDLYNAGDKKGALKLLLCNSLLFWEMLITRSYVKFQRHLAEKSENKQ